MSRDDERDPLYDAVKELTEPRLTVTARHTWTPSRNKKPLETWRTEHPSLLDELEDAVHPAGSTDDGGGHGVPGSRSPADDAAIATAMRIRDEATLWLIRLGLLSRDNLTYDIAALLGASGSIDPQLRANLTADACRWVVWARVTTGWQTAPTMLRGARCPACGALNQLLVRWDSGVACCLLCGADWRKTDGSINLLADQVRAQTEGEAV